MDEPGGSTSALYTRRMNTCDYIVMLTVSGADRISDINLFQVHLWYLIVSSLPLYFTVSMLKEELEWDTLFARPHVQEGLNRLAREAERQFSMGEMEEGGFAVE